MLRIFCSLKDINFSKLMSVYEEGNLENAKEFYPNLEPNVALINAEQDFYAYLRDIFFVTSGAVYAVWEENGDYVSALRLEPYCNGLLLEGLETSPVHRRKGFAATLIQSVLAYLSLQENCLVYSHISKWNVASLRTHESCGFKRIQEYAVYIDGSVRKDSCTLLFEINR